MGINKSIDGEQVKYSDMVTTKTDLEELESLLKAGIELAAEFARIRSKKK